MCMHLMPLAATVNTNFLIHLHLFQVLKELLSTTERVVQEVDSVEYGLTDIQVCCGCMHGGFYGGGFEVAVIHCNGPGGAAHVYL